MSTSNRLIVIGASARAAAFSAIRSGFAPFWIDLFGDLDLAEVAEGRVVPAQGYPSDLITLAEQAPPAPWMYTGAIENHLDVVTAISTRRPLLGNDAETCAAVRNPMRLSDCFAKAGIHFPEISRSTQDISRNHAWIVKPLRSGGGIAISRYRDTAPFDADQHYLQEFIEGRPVAAVLSFLYRDEIHPFYGASDPACNRQATNNYMYFDLMRWAHEQGRRWFDFGRSRIGSGSYEFKAHWGMEEVALPYEMLLVKRKELPHLSPANPRFKLAIALWRRLPLGLTRAIGPHLIELVP